MGPDNTVIENKGERLIKFKTSEGWNKSIMFQDAAVGRCLISVDKLNAAGCEVILKKKFPRVATAIGEVNKLIKKNGVFRMKLWIEKPGFTRPAKP